MLQYNQYTDEQIKYLIKLKEEEQLEWKNIAKKFNNEFEKEKTIGALRKVYSRYRNIDFSNDSFIANAKQVFSTKKRDSRLVRENKILIGEMANLEEARETFTLLLDKVKFKLHKPIKHRTKSSKIKRTLVAHLSDTHYGENISLGEMGGLNEYNPLVAARRTALFFKQTSDYKIQHRGETDLVLLLNGDLAAGIIHNQENGVELMTKQFAILLTIIGQGITYLAQRFDKITVYCTPDNHMRFQHKASKNRVRSQKWDSFATMAYLALKNEFKKYPNIKFIIPESPYVIFEAQGKKCLATHGDTVFDVGNPSKVLNLEKIGAEINKINNSDLAIEDKIDIFFIAHVHTPMIALLDNGSYVFINGCLSGLNTFGQSIGLFGNHPTQQIVELTKDYVGDCRLVRVKKGDEDKSLDKIIEYDEKFLD